MLVPGQIVEISWNASNIRHYTQLGYKYTKLREIFEVKVEDLPKYSAVKVSVVCDYCGNTYKKNWSSFLTQRENGKDCCRDCAKYKRMETNNEKYGGNAPACSKEVVSKMKETCLKNYGVENPMGSENIKEKAKKTLNERYHVDYPMQCKEIFQKQKKTNLERYGNECVLASEKVKSKTKETVLQKYGVPYISQIPEIKEKVRNTLYKNGTTPVSKEQIQVNNMLAELYGGSKLNFPFGPLNLDCYIEVDGVKIDVEYDCWYWHKNRQLQDRKRNYVLLENGFKIIRILATKEIPTYGQLEEAVNRLVKGDKSLIYIKLDVQDEDII